MKTYPRNRMNADGRPMTALEEFQELREQKHLHERANGANHGGDQRSSKGGESFIKVAAKALGKSPATVYAEIQAATALDPEVQEVIKDLPIANSRTELKQLARMPISEQRKRFGI